MCALVCVYVKCSYLVHGYEQDYAPRLFKWSFFLIISYKILFIFWMFYTHATCPSNVLIHGLCFIAFMYVALLFMSKTELQSENCVKY